MKFIIVTINCILVACVAHENTTTYSINNITLNQNNLASKTTEIINLKLSDVEFFQNKKYSVKKPYSKPFMSKSNDVCYLYKFCDINGIYHDVAVGLDDDKIVEIKIYTYPDNFGGDLIHP